MKNIEYDVVVAGGGIGGISAAVTAARCGARTLLIDANQRLGGTGVFSPLGIVCGLGPTSERWVNEGILRDFFPDLWNGERFPITLPYYDAKTLADRYAAITSAEMNLEVWLETSVASVILSEEKCIESVSLSGREKARVGGRVFIDGTANGNLSALAGAEFQFGRETDGKLQPCTLTFVVREVAVELLDLPGPKPFSIRNNDEKKVLSDALGLDKAWCRLKTEGRTTNPKQQDWVLFFPSQDGRTLVFNHSRVVDINPLIPEDLERGYDLAKKQILEFWEEIKSHPALKHALLEISPSLGVREGRRIIGEYILTKDDCLGEARFEDMVAACCYSIDIHDPKGSHTELVEIPGSGYYHIPYRSLRAKGWRNLLLASRCLSGTHEAHSSYRVMAPLSAVGQACGVAAALMVATGARSTAEVKPSQIRYVLDSQHQFVEGSLEAVANCRGCNGGTE